MSVSKSFLAHALDLLGGVGEVVARPMFGGHGIYLRGQMFALLEDDELFLKTDAQSRARFADPGCRPFTYRGPRGLTETSYVRPPDEAFEHAEAMRPWAELGLEAAQRKAKKPGSRARRAR